MGQAANPASSLIQWGVAAKAMSEQTESGDRYLVKSFPNGVLIGVVDGIGHGKEAATVADIAIAILEAHTQESVITLLQLCHERLIETRGVVMSLASLNAKDHTMTWIGVGNVDGVLLHGEPLSNPAQEYILLRGGLIGHQLPPLRASVIPIIRGDTLIFATDGIHYHFPLDLKLNDPPQRIADHIMAKHRRGTDDALVLVAQYIT